MTKRAHRARIVADCILFDLDCTLYTSAEYSDRLESEILQYVSWKLRMPECECRQLLKDRRKRLGTLTRTLASLNIDREQFFRDIAERLEPSQYLSGDAKVRSMLDELRRQGFKLALVSNSGRPLVLKILTAIGLDTELFDAVVTSSDAEPKPSHASFELAMNRLGCTAKSTVYVGDRVDSELRPAHELGISTILVGGEKSDLPSQYVDLILEDITELPRVIRVDAK